MNNPFNSENVQIQPISIKALEYLQLGVTKEHLQEVLTNANYAASDGPWTIDDFKLVAVKFINDKMHVIYDITLKGEGWSKTDTVSLPFETETGELLAI